MVKDHSIDINDLATSGPDDQLDILGDGDSVSADVSSTAGQSNIANTEPAKFSNFITADDSADPSVSLMPISEREEMADGKVSMATQVCLCLIRFTPQQNATLL